MRSKEKWQNSTMAYYVNNCIFKKKKKKKKAIGGRNTVIFFFVYIIIYDNICIYDNNSLLTTFIKCRQSILNLANGKLQYRWSAPPAVSSITGSLLQNIRGFVLFYFIHGVDPTIAFSDLIAAKMFCVYVYFVLFYLCIRPVTIISIKSQIVIHQDSN